MNYLTNKFMALVFKPRFNTESVLSGTKEAGLFLSGLSTVIENGKNLDNEKQR